MKEVNEKPVISGSLLDDTRIYNSWNQVVDTDDAFKYDLLVMRLRRHTGFVRQYRSVFNDIIQSPDEDDVEGLAIAVENYINYGDLLLQSEAYKDYPIMKATVKKLTEKSYGNSKANLIPCLLHFDHIVEDYELTPATLFIRLNAWNSYLNFKDTSVTDLPSILFETASTIDNNLSKTLHNACDEYYSSLSQGQWKEHILSKDDTYRIWRLYHPKKYQANFDALKAILKEYARGMSSMPNKLLIDECLGYCLEVKHSLKELFNDISAILKHDSIINKEKLLFFGSNILEYSDAEKQKDFILKLIPTEIIDADVIGFIEEHIDRLKGCELSDEFKEKVKHLAVTSMKDDERIAILCKHLRIDLDKKSDNE